MVDMFPFPSVTEGTPEKQIAELLNYLIQFKETLEFALTNISAENLSPDLIKKLNDLGTNIEVSNTNREEEITQISNNAITLSDVINQIDKKLGGITFSINYDTGHLEYTTS